VLDRRCAAGPEARLVLRKYAEQLWRIPTGHFDPDAARAFRVRAPIPLEDVLVVGSTYQRGNLKARLYAEGLERPICELCGQGEMWRGRRMGLVLDHVNGVRDDHRLENLRILCPNCNATLDTHCGRNARELEIERACARCGASFRPKRDRHRYCSRECGQRADHAGPRPQTRRVERPTREELLAELAASSYLAVGRRYGVSDNAVRKWVRAYERAGAVTGEGGRGPPPA
jgi:hypothetical protein